MQCSQPQLVNMDRSNLCNDASSDAMSFAASAPERSFFGTDEPTNQSTPSSAASIPIVDDELRCRYSNKKCMNPRTEKRTGGLHTFCEEHRESANRNQRRLDQKKRVEKRQKESIQSYYETLQAVGEYPSTSQLPHVVSGTGQLLPAQTVPPLEPFARPAALLGEDLDTLVSLFGLEDRAGGERFGNNGDLA